MKFSTATLIAAAGLVAAAPAPQQNAQNSDVIYQLQAATQNNQFNQQQLYTDGDNIYYGPQQQNVAANGQPLVAINVYMDNNGAMQSTDNNRYVSVGDNGRMQMSDQRRHGRWNMQNNNNQDNQDVSLKFNNDQVFLACPVQNSNNNNNGGWGNQNNWNNRDRSRGRNKREESETAAARKDRQNWNNQNQGWNQQQNNNQVYQVYVNNAPCANPVQLSLNGQRRGRRNGRNNQKGRNNKRDTDDDEDDETNDSDDSEEAQATIILRVNGNSNSGNSNQMYSPVFNQDGRMYTRMGQMDFQGQHQNNMFQNGMFQGHQMNNYMYQMHQGRLQDMQSRQYAQLGRNQQLSMTNNQNQGLLFTVDIMGNLQYNDNQFLACASGNDGLYEVRPTGAEGAAASCTNAQAIVIQIDRQGQDQRQRQQQIEDDRQQRQQQQTQDQQDRDQQRQRLQQQRQDRQDQRQE